MRFYFPFYALLALLGFSSISLATPDTWTKKSDMPFIRWGLATSVVNDKIYVIGGWGSDIVEEYDPATDQWTRKADMPAIRGALSAIAVNGKIYAIGGRTGGIPSFPTVEAYDPLTDTWTKKADMPTGRSALATSIVRGKIYAIGGATAVAGTTSAVEEYDPISDKWSKKADMPTTRGFVSASAVNGKIYVFGGYPIHSTVEEYDPLTDTWSQKADMPTGRNALATPMVNGKIYAIGGDRSNQGLPTVEEYDPLTDTWTKKTDMLTARTGHAASAVNGKIYVISGMAVWGLIPVILTVEEYDTGFAEEYIDFYINSVFPNFGDSKGGAPVQIQGENFIAGSKVFFGGVESNNVKVESPFLITAVAPAKTLGLVDVEMVRPDGKRAVLKNGFQYAAINVKLIKVTPESGPVVGEVKVQLEGFGFLPGAEAQFGDKKLINPFVTPFSIQGILPPGTPGAVSVSVINPNGEKDVLKNAFTYVPPPAIKEISNIYVPVVGGTELIIKGSGFISKPTVHVGTARASSVDFISSSELKIYTPTLTTIGPQDVIATNPDGQRAVLPKGATALAPISIESVEPDRGGLEGGTKIAITGRPFVASFGRAFSSRFVKGAEVVIGKENATEVKVISDNLITAITPPNSAGPKNILVINPDGQQSFFPDGFSYNPLPQVIKVIPNNGALAGGAKVTIQGSKFLSNAKVLFGDIFERSFVVSPAVEIASDAFITAITPPSLESGPKDVVVVNVDGQEAILRDGYTYNPFPTIREVSPNYGPASGGTKVIIRGFNFIQGAKVIVGKSVAVASVRDDMTIEAVTGSNPKGRLDVRVINPDTQEAIKEKGFVSLGELAYNFPNPFEASRGTTFRYVPLPNESVESMVVRIINMKGEIIGAVGAQGVGDVRWVDDKLNAGLYVYSIEVKLTDGQMRRFRRTLVVK